MTLVISHANCYDGFVAGWLAHRYGQRTGKDITVHFATHGSPPPDVVGKDVLLFDFCYSRSTLTKMYADANDVSVYDHHKSAAEDCGDLPFCHFDMDSSGAGLAGTYFIESNEFANLVTNYVEDRDLWRFDLRGSREITSAIYSWPFDFEFWDAKLAAGTTLSELIEQGRAIQQLNSTMVANIIKNSYLIELEPGIQVPSVNVYVDRVSDTLAALLEKYPDSPYSVGWYLDAEGTYRYSLRSTGDRNYDVSVLATKFGGGGHKLAAGFASATHLI